MNLYSYCHNNPITYYDPTGHWRNEIEEKFASMFWNKDDYDKMEKLGEDWNYYNQMYLDSTNTQDKISYYNARNKAKREAEELRKRNNEKGTYNYLYENEMDGLYLKEVHKFEINEKGEVISHFSQTQNSKFTYETNFEIPTKEIEHNNQLNFKTGKKENLTYLEHDTVSSKNIGRISKVLGYLKTSASQVVLGHFAEDVTLLGTAGEIALGITGLDLPGNIRDIGHDLYNWEWSWSHVGKTALDTVGLIPVVGALRYSDEVHTIAKGVKRGKGIRKGMGKLSGKWIKANEAMSDLSRSYQKQIAGTDMVWLQNGVKFDGINAGRLIEAKANYKNFVNKKTGRFYDWFNGQDSLIDQAMRQIDAADGAPIDWYFMDETSMNATKKLFSEEGINGINFILTIEIVLWRCKMKTFTLVMWAKPRVESADNTVKRVYKVLEALKRYGEEVAPNYITARRKRDTIEFSLEENSIREVLLKKTKKEGNNKFSDLGCTISFFSSMNDDESCGIRMKVGVSNEKFKNTLVIHFPSTFSGYKHRVTEFEELFKSIIRIFEPYWACIANDKNIEMFDNEYWISDKPSTIHWLNYFGGDIARKLEIQKIKDENFVYLDELLDGYILKLQDEPFNVSNKRHIERQREINKCLGLT